MKLIDHNIQYLNENKQWQLKKSSKMNRNQAIGNREGAIACKNFLSMANLMAKNCIMISQKMSVYIIHY